MADTLRILRQGDNIKAYRQSDVEKARVRISGLDNPADFRFVHRVLGRNKEVFGTGLDLDDNQFVLLFRNDVEFVVMEMPVSAHDVVSALFEIRTRLLLSLLANLRL